MIKEITKVEELDSKDQYKGVMIYIYSEGIDILGKLKEKILQMHEKCTAEFEQRKYNENRPMLVIEGDFSSEHLKDILDYLSGQNIAYAVVNASGELQLSFRPQKAENNEELNQGSIEDALAEVDLKGEE